MQDLHTFYEVCRHFSHRQIGNLTICIPATNGNKLFYQFPALIKIRQLIERHKLIKEISAKCFQPLFKEGLIIIIVSPCITYRLHRRQHDSTNTVHINQAHNILSVILPCLSAIHAALHVSLILIISIDQHARRGRRFGHK